MITGWELRNPQDALLFKGKQLTELKKYTDGNKLSCLNNVQDIFLVIRPYHPSLNCPPDDQQHQSRSFKIGLAYFTYSSYMWFYLPVRHEYTGIEITGDVAGRTEAITITTKEGSVVTNFNELSRKLSSIRVSTEEEIEKGFAALVNDRVVKERPPITQTTIQSAVLGTMEQSDFDDWWISKPVEIGFFEDEQLPVQYISFNPALDETFIQEADETITHLLNKDKAYRLSISDHVYRNCINFLESIEPEEEDRAMLEMQRPEDVWSFVQPSSIYVSREPEDEQVYVRLTCNCDWETEHGLQLVFNRQGQLIRVSADDGDNLGWKGDGMIS